jgi:hypothetical protein
MMTPDQIGSGQNPGLQTLDSQADLVTVFCSKTSTYLLTFMCSNPAIFTFHDQNIGDVNPGLVDSVPSGLEEG